MQLGELPKMRQETKTCKKCHETKPTSLFYRAKGNWDGLQHQCAQCKRDYMNARYKPVQKRGQDNEAGKNDRRQTAGE